MKTLSEFLKAKEKKFDSVPIEECTVDGIVVEEGDDIDIFLDKYVQNGEKRIVLEHQIYKQYGKSKVKVYRIDKGNGGVGCQTHIHVKNKHGELFAMNIDGTSHDGSKVKLSKHDINTLKKLGFEVPDNGILEWYNGETDGKMLLCD